MFIVLLLLYSLPCLASVASVENSLVTFHGGEIALTSTNNTFTLHKTTFSHPALYIARTHKSDIDNYMEIILPLVSINQLESKKPVLLFSHNGPNEHMTAAISPLIQTFLDDLDGSRAQFMLPLLYLTTNKTFSFKEEVHLKQFYRFMLKKKLNLTIQNNGNQVTVVHRSNSNRTIHELSSKHWYQGALRLKMRQQDIDLNVVDFNQLEFGTAMKMMFQSNLIAAVEHDDLYWTAALRPRTTLILLCPVACSKKVRQFVKTNPSKLVIIEVPVEKIVANGKILTAKSKSLYFREKRYENVSISFNGEELSDLILKHFKS
ncbi:hypothetical protein RCL1_003528 [Eukaryota sp. TZLM3-RCL]